jgi:hypothetical protein
VDGGIKQIANRLHAIRNPKRHRWRAAQGLMYAAEIMERDVKAHGGKVRILLLAKAVAQPRELLRSDLRR